MPIESATGGSGSKDILCANLVAADRNQAPGASERYELNREAALDDRWSGLYENCRPALYRAAALMVGAAEAEEVVQEVFERAMREPAFFDRVEEPMAWLRTLTARRALGRMRRRRILERLRLRPQSTGVEPWERAHLAVGLSRLASRERVALVLRYYAEASYEEIASALGIASSSIGPLLTRARSHLRDHLC
jgi:RNA polymerase sigma factor (sigma-70 family)